MRLPDHRAGLDKQARHHAPDRRPNVDARLVRRRDAVRPPLAAARAREGVDLDASESQEHLRPERKDRQQIYQTEDGQAVPVQFPELFIRGTSEKRGGFFSSYLATLASFKCPWFRQTYLNFS